MLSASFRAQVAASGDVSAYSGLSVTGGATVSGTTTVTGKVDVSETNRVFFQFPHVHSREPIYVVVPLHLL